MRKRLRYIYIYIYMYILEGFFFVFTMHLPLCMYLCIYVTCRRYSKKNSKNCLKDENGPKLQVDEALWVSYMSMGSSIILVQEKVTAGRLISSNIYIVLLCICMYLRLSGHPKSVCLLCCIFC